MIKTLNYKFFLRNQVRAVLRGHRILRKKHMLNLPVSIRQQLSRISLDDFSKKTSKYIFHDSLSNSDLIIRQYLMIRVCGSYISRSLLAAVGGSKTPFHILPNYMLNIIRKNNVPVANFSSLILWYLYVLSVWGYSIIKFFKSVYYQLPKRKILCTNKLAFFLNLSENNFPAINTVEKSYDLISWYSNWKHRNISITGVCHNLNPIKIKTVSKLNIFKIQTEFKEFVNWKQLILFIIWGLYAITRSFLDLLIGRWWHALLLNEAIKARIMHLHKKEDVFAEYWFSHTNYTYKPIWTYNAEIKGSKLFLYFYSINNHAIQPKYDENFSIGNWHLMNWPIYIALGNHNKNFLQKYVSRKSQIIVENNFYFSDSGIEIGKNKKPVIAVFDIQPHRPYIHAKNAQVYEYYHPKTSEKFFDDILTLSKEYNLNILWKKKRKIGKTEHRYYKTLSKKLSSFENVMCPDPSISAHRIIEKANFVINMPFTTTALIAKNLGKPSCYYDTLEIIDKNDQGSSNIEIIHGYQNLSHWLKKNI
jgi:polysaccharide biosynthesis PFTS motif protein